MQLLGYRFWDVEYYFFLVENDNYDFLLFFFFEVDVVDWVWFICDGCGMICVVMMWFLVVYVDFVVIFVMLLFFKDFWYFVVNGVIFNCLVVFVLLFYLRIMFIDFGVVFKGNVIKEYMESLQLKFGEVIYKCLKCCCIKFECVYYCSICKRCIWKMDYYCLWVNNCVGEKN